MARIILSGMSSQKLGLIKVATRRRSVKTIPSSELQFVNYLHFMFYFIVRFPIDGSSSGAGRESLLRLNTSYFESFIADAPSARLIPLLAWMQTSFTL